MTARRAWQLAGAAAAVAVVVAGKQFYRGASPDQLQWLLAPIAKLAGAATGTHFAYDPSAGWVSRSAAFVIAPACAGLNFALAAFLALVLGWLPAMRGPRAVAARLLAAAALAYVATVVVDAARIALSLELGARGDAHQALGVAVYLAGLCALCALVRRRQGDAVAC